VNITGCLIALPFIIYVSVCLVLLVYNVYKIPSDIREHSKSHVLSGDIFSAIYFRTIICSICWYIGFIERIIKYIEGTCVDRFKNWVYRNEEYD